MSDTIDETRLFFVVDSIEDNEEIFETLEEALKHKSTLYREHYPRVYIGLVRHAYREEDLGKWNYDDCSDTFELVKLVA